MSDIDIIMVISPGYIGAVLKCIRKYHRVAVVGYSDISEALKCLVRVPGSSYLGFSYIADDINNEDVLLLRSLINKINIMYDGLGQKIPFLFMFSSSMKKSIISVIKTIIGGLNTENIQFGYDSYPMVTDDLIKLKVVGSLLLRRRKFELILPKYEATSNRENALTIDVPIEHKFLEVFKPLTFREIDPYFTKYRDDVIMCKIRMYLYDPSGGGLEDIKKDIDKLSYKERIFYDVCMRRLQKE